MLSILRVALFSRCHAKQTLFSRNPLHPYTLTKGNSAIEIVKRKITTNFQLYRGENSARKKNILLLYKCGFTGAGLAAAIVIKTSTNVLAHGSVKLKVVEDSKELSFKWKEFLKYLYCHVWYLLIALSSALVVAVLNIWIPQCVGDVINVLTKLAQGKGNESAGNMIAQLVQPALALARMYIAQALFTFVYIYTLSHIGERIAMKLREDLFRSIIMQDVAFFDKNRTGEIVSRLTSDIQDFKSSFKTCISQGLRSVTQIAGCVVSIIVLSPQLTGIMILCVPTVILIGSLLGRSLRKMSAEAQNQVAKSTAICEEAIQNIKTVRAFAAEEREIEKYNAQVELASAQYERLGFGIGLFQAGTNLFLNGTLLCTLYFGGHLMSTGQLSPGDVMAFLMATQTIQRSLSQLSLIFGTYIRGISAGARVFEYLGMPPSPMMVGGEIMEDMSMAGNVAFTNVKFSYPTRPDHTIFNNFNLNIPAGKTVAIVGSSGNGKSTVAALLERFYDVDSGTVSIDGKDIKSLNSSYLRGNVLGYIDQEPILFATSILENIRYGKHKATDDEVMEAAKEANAHDFIMKFPNGYDTEVGERGAQLSGGQKQRIAIARALLKQPSILILDEATSALDYESERVVQKALENATRGRTVLVIAHRLSTVKGADIIVVLQRGAIVEMGTHSELLKKKGAYYTLVSEQEKEDN